jgi:hypothetical protein
MPPPNSGAELAGWECAQHEATECLGSCAAVVTAFASRPYTTPESCRLATMGKSAVTGLVSQSNAGPHSDAQPNKR